MNIEQNKFLTEAMGECWHEGSSSKIYRCVKCSVCHMINPALSVEQLNPDFSTWEGFGKLWEWAQEQEWWYLFLSYFNQVDNWMHFTLLPRLIHPDRFANAVYQFLKERNHEIY